ncbi:CRE-DUO-3 protein [Caenorhabditis remanei]|uniref:CRE-DUO-3 protein n=1 Tax=Caenorhabditis remanei TaxID=31234 RepID=E3LW25_CAERE|nr:CRE-DUO-3 protein [Caenorhabditis remanei]
MTDKFVVDVTIFANTSEKMLITLKDHRIKFEGRTIKVLKASSFETVREFDSSLLLNKPLKHPDVRERTVLSIQFASSPGLKLAFHNSNRDYAQYVVEEYNKFLEANKDKVQQVRAKTTHVPTVGPQRSITSSVPTKENQYQEYAPKIPVMKPSVSANSYSPSPKRKPLLPPVSSISPRNFNVAPGSAQKPSTSSGNPNIYKREPNTSSTKSPGQHARVSQLRSNEKLATQNGSRNGLQNSADAHREKLNMLMPETIPRKKGLKNTGNSCFFNATMQAFASSPSIVSRCNQLSRVTSMYSRVFNVEDDSIMKFKLNVFEGFLTMIQHLTRTPDIVSIQKLKEIRRSAGFLVGRFHTPEQQDVHEYLLLVIDCINDVIKDKVKSPPDVKSNESPVFVKALAGLNPMHAIQSITEKEYQCVNCSKKSVESVSNLIVQLAIDETRNGSIELGDLLDVYFATESLDKRCSSCNTEDAFVRERFVKFSPCIILNPLRTQHSGGEDGSRKDSRQINVPLKLDLTKFTSFAKVCKSDENLNLNGVGTPQISSSKITSTKNLMLNGGMKCSSPFKVLGGAKEPSEDDDIQFDNEIINNPFYFELISCPEELKKMARLLGIKYNKKFMEYHVSILKEKPSTDMKKNDYPDEKSVIDGDGNCFFRAISWFLTGTEGHHKQVRKVLVEYMKNNQSALEKHCTAPSYERHVRDMSKDATWATGCEIAAISKLLNVNIYTFLPSGWSLQQPQTGVASKKGSIYLNNLSEHYEPVTSLKKHGADSRDRRAHKRRCVRDGGEEGDAEISKNAESSSKNKTITPAKLPTKQKPTRSCNTEKKPKEADPSELCIYQLIAAICHIGNMKFGHYYAYTKNLNDDKWLKCDDHKITDVSVGEVIDAVSYRCHLLFYERQ